MPRRRRNRPRQHLEFAQERDQVLQASAESVQPPADQNVEASAFGITDTGERRENSVTPALSLDTSGSNSVVESRLPKPLVAGSIPVSRSIRLRVKLDHILEDPSAAFQPNGSGERDDRRCHWREEGR